jgi:ACS family tartrate transporter-like MFS transporter
MFQVAPLPALAPPNVLRKVTWRLLPFLCLLYVFNILDRANVGFAKLTMQDDVGISPAVFDLGIGIFYFGYLAFEVPANLLLRRFGARRWMARIMISWGFVSCATMAVNGPVSFYAVRILLGVAEAGFFPGIILYLTFWYPARERARVTAYFMLAIALSGIFGNPLSGLIVDQLGGTAGVAGWRWLFLVEGIPSVLLGIWVLFYLPDGPDDATWLRPDEREWLKAQLRVEQAQLPPHGQGLLGALAHPGLWLLICLYFPIAVGANAAGAYFPTLIKDGFAGARPLKIGLLAALPHVGAILAMTGLAWSSDRTGERAIHVAFAALVASTGWLLAAVADSAWLALAGLCLAQAGMMAMLPTFWAIPPSILGGTAAAGGIALINSVANLGGLFGPTILGSSSRNGPAIVSWLRLERVVPPAVADRFGLVVMALLLFVGCGLALCVPRRRPVVAKVEGGTAAGSSQIVASPGEFHADRG